MDSCSKKNIFNPSKKSETDLNILKIVEGTKNGENIKFFIAQLPKNRYQDAIFLLTEYFYAEEAILAALNIKEDPLMIQELIEPLPDIFDQGMTLGAFLENKNLVALEIIRSVGDKSSPDLTGKRKSEKWKNLLAVFNKIEEIVDLKKKFDISCDLEGFGLIVHPLYRGFSLSFHLLEVSAIICREKGFNAIEDIFTSPASIKSAERAGFEVVTEISFNEFTDDEGRPLFSNCNSKSMKYMVKKLK